MLYFYFSSIIYLLGILRERQRRLTLSWA